MTMTMTNPIGGRAAARAAMDELLERESREMVVVIDADLRLVSVQEDHPAHHRWCDIDFEAMVGQPVIELVHPDDRPECERKLGMVFAGVATGGTELRIGPLGGPYRYVIALGRIHADDRGRPGLVVLLRDIEERRSMQDALAHLALHDPLTNLPNRNLFSDRLEQVLTRRFDQPPGIGIMVVNLDRFTLVNEGLGPLAGDEVLVRVAARLRSSIRAGDTLARLGGDEFGIICEGIAREHDLISYAERVRDAVRSPLELASGSSVSLDASIGLAFAPEGAPAGRALHREADAAKSVVKARGRGGVELSTGGLSDLAREHLRLEQELRLAITGGQLCVHYQPQVDHQTGRTVGVEALVRWNHPTRGLVPPGAFIPVAEDSDLIVDIGRFVLATACRDVAGWRGAGLDVELSVNLAARHLVAPGFADEVTGVLDAAGLDPGALTLEVTESTLFTDTDAVTATIDRVRSLGVHLALDDFGTGYSSLVYLRRFHVEQLKIDQSFVRGIGVDSEDETIIRGIINLARSLGIGLVAEGVEHEAAADWLVAAGCEVIQGYLYSRPVPGTELLAWIDRTSQERPFSPHSGRPLDAPQHPALTLPDA